jgi:AraC-like DNA-binding protein
LIHDPGGVIQNDTSRIRIGSIHGYESKASFTNAFKRNFRISPKEYRERQLAGIG